MTHLHIDLCSGTGGWQAPFRDASDWRTVGVEIRADLSPDVRGDVRQLPLNPSQDVTLVTASPPCTPYSSAWNAVKPPAVRYPDFTLWNACVKAIVDLDPEYAILENVAQAQYWHGPSDKHIGPYHFWGMFPMFDVGGLRDKGTGRAAVHRADIVDTDGAARIPYAIGDALRQSVEWYVG